MWGAAAPAQAEFRQWMDARQATDLAWGSWFLLKGAEA